MLSNPIAQRVINPERLSEVEKTLNQMIRSVDLNPVQNIQLSVEILKIFSILFHEWNNKEREKFFRLLRKLEVFCRTYRLSQSQQESCLTCLVKT